MAVYSSWSSIIVIIVFLSLTLFHVYPVEADTPANCTYEEIKGTWILSLGSGNHKNDINCSKFDVKTSIKVKLTYPNVATDQFDNMGFWTMIYNQGFEITIGGRKYFAFSKYGNGKSFCGETMPATSHDVLGRDWACFTGHKQSNVSMKVNNEKDSTSLHFVQEYLSDESVAAAINAAQTSWKATTYKSWVGMSIEDRLKFAGGNKSKVLHRPKTSALTEEHKRIIDSLPEGFDWRDVHGVNYVSPVRNQGACGSCYAFASVGMIEARVRIMTNNTQKPVFSPQDVVECSRYSQGCNGGFPYLIGGKYAEDYGLVEELCNPYRGEDGSCSTKPVAPRHYATKYRYVGGYYGGCNEAVMMQAISDSGPVAVGFEVYSDFGSYRSGIYHHVTQSKLPGFNPFELTNHAVLVVGWGTDKKTREKYWIVKNSWGESWGEQGFFRIRRGTDECGIESMAAESFPIMNYNKGNW